MNSIEDTDKKDLSSLAQRIRDARINARLSQAELAGSIGVSDKSISAYEQGRSNPPFDKLKKIAEHTGHSITFFMAEKTEEAQIVTKLASIEKELAEVKRLLKSYK